MKFFNMVSAEKKLRKSHQEVGKGIGEDERMAGGERRGQQTDRTERRKEFDTSF